MEHTNKLKDVACIHFHVKLHSGKRAVATRYFTDDEIDTTALKEGCQEQLSAFAQAISSSSKERVICSDIEIVLIR